MNLCYPIFLLAILCCLSCQKKQEPKTPLLPRPVRVVKVETLGSITRQYTGIVTAGEFSILAFKVSGTLTELNFKAGQHVEKNDVIARINPYDFQRQYLTAQANYQAAKSIYQRNKRLYAANAVAKQNLEIAEADYIQATSALNIARRTLGYTSLTAPFTGFIEQRYVENYEEILTGEPIVRLVNPDSIEVQFTLPETGIQLLNIPKKIYVEFDSQKGKLFTSDVKEYIYASDGSGLPVTLIITDAAFEPYRKNVLPGFSCKVIWEIDNMISDKIIIPPGAIIQKDGKEYVWIINPETQTAEQQQIITSRLDGHILVESGLAGNNYIVVAGASSMQKGEKVTMQTVTP